MTTLEVIPLPEHYPPEVYRAADKAMRQCTASYDASTTRVKNQSVGPTNALMQALQAEFVDPLSQIANLHARVIAPAIDTDLIKSVDAVFSRILTLSPPVDDKKLSPLLQSKREEYWKRTFNILFSQFHTLLMDVSVFLRRRHNITPAEAAARLCTRPKNSIADSIALLALDRLIKIGPIGEQYLKLKKEFLDILFPKYRRLAEEYIAFGRVGIISPEELEKHMRTGAAVAEQIYGKISADHQAFKERLIKENQEATRHLERTMRDLVEEARHSYLPIASEGIYIISPEELEEHRRAGAAIAEEFHSKVAADYHERRAQIIQEWERVIQKKFMGFAEEANRMHPLDLLSCSNAFIAKDQENKNLESVEREILQKGYAFLLRYHGVYQDAERNIVIIGRTEMTVTAGSLSP